ncbi:MAG: hypothetical protein ABSF77_02400 [Spirochaetia bacterium]
MNEKLHERARRVRERSLIRAWEYRQRNYSNGVWHRLRRILVDAAEAWIIDEADADALEARGHAPHPVGRELDPPKRLFFLTKEELEALPHRRQVPVRLHSELLLARSLAFVPIMSIKKST